MVARLENLQVLRFNNIWRHSYGPFTLRAHYARSVNAVI